MTMLIVFSISFIAGFAMVWSYRSGKKSNELDHVKSTLKKIGNVNEYAREEDIDAERQVRSAGDNPVGAPWLRNKQ